MRVSHGNAASRHASARDQLSLITGQITRLGKQITDVIATAAEAYDSPKNAM